MNERPEHAERTPSPEKEASHRCPICERPVATDLATFPFCSTRCRMVDLGRWFCGTYTISRPLRNEDDEREM